MELIKKRITLDLPKDLTNFTRLANRYNWYNVGRSYWYQSFTDNNIQKLEDIGSISIDDGTRGPEKGNNPLRFEITAGSSTNGLKLEVGSVGLVTLGNVNPIARVKSADFNDEITSTDAWVPLRIFKLQDNKDIVNVQITALNILNYDTDDEVRLLGKIVEKENVSLGSDGWSVPSEWLRANNALEMRTDINSIPNNDGTTSATVSNPGGYQVGRSILIPISGQYQKGALSGGQQFQKRGIPQDKYLVILGKSSSLGNVDYEVIFEQDF